MAPRKRSTTLMETLLDDDEGTAPEESSAPVEPEESLEAAAPPEPPAAPAPTPKPAAPAVTPTQPLVDFRVWAVASGVKLDQLAGFARYAEAQGLRKLTIPGWRDALDAFRNRPTR